jgi:hypothetical protein
MPIKKHQDFEHVTLTVGELRKFLEGVDDSVVVKTWDVLDEIDRMPIELALTDGWPGDTPELHIRS